MVSTRQIQQVPNAGAIRPAYEREMSAEDPISHYKGFPDAQADMATLAHLEEVADKIRGFAPPTLIEQSEEKSSQYGVQVLYKREDASRINSFKWRGPVNALTSWLDEKRRKGVIAPSAGNHAQGVAWAAQQTDTKAFIVMPETTARKKIKAVERLGAEIILEGNKFDQAYEASLRLEERMGATILHPFDDPDVIDGQASVGVEIFQQRPDVTHIFVPVGGGGLLAGTVNYIKAIEPRIKVIGVEPEDSNAMQRSLLEKRRVKLPHPGTFVDGTSVGLVGLNTFEAAQKADGVITVNEDELCLSLADFLSETGSVLETAGALSLAGLKKYHAQFGLAESSVVAAICSGSNIDNSRLKYVLERAEMTTEKRAKLRIELVERPGQFLDLYKKVIEGMNITDIEYRRLSPGAIRAEIILGLDVSRDGQQDLVERRLGEHGYSYDDLHQHPVVKEHGVQVLGAPPKLNQETFYEVGFFNRKGALGEFLHTLAAKGNISYFKYNGDEGSIGRVLIGFDGTPQVTLQKALEETTYFHSRLSDEAVKAHFGKTVA